MPARAGCQKDFRGALALVLYAPMPNVVFVLPFVMERSFGFVSGALAVPGVRLGIVSQEPADKLPPSIRDRLVGHWQVQNAFDPFQIAEGVRGIEKQMGRVDR